MLVNLYKGSRKLFRTLKSSIYTPIGHFQFFVNGAKVGKRLKVLGPLHIYVTRRGVLKIGEGVRINSGSKYNVIGRQQKTILWVEGVLEIGNEVGMSSTAIICNKKISIGNNVVIGGNTVIYDSDFHSLDPMIRKNKINDKKNAKSAEVIIEDNVFIGAHSTILKGVRIGENSIVGTCSVVAGNIPSNEIWAGNPAKFIKKV